MEHAQHRIAIAFTPAELMDLIRRHLQDHVQGPLPEWPNERIEICHLKDRKSGNWYPGFCYVMGSAPA